MNNIITQTDSYKVSHFLQYPPGTETVFSYLESRTGSRYSESIFFGLGYILAKYLEGVVVTKEKIEEAKELFANHFGPDFVFNEKGWQHIIDKHGGMLPVEIRAVPEGTVVPESNVMLTIRNTDPQVPWLTNYLETLLVQIWYPITVCTQSNTIRKLILSYLNANGDPNLVDFKLHDFGFRGVSSTESAGIGGCAHLVNFKGTDTMEALVIAKKYYNESAAGFSIPAAEHSTITTWKNEIDAFDNMLNQYPNGLVAVVSDSYDIFRACKEYWGNILKEKVLARNGVLVIRPDSGDPVETVFKVMQILSEQFECSVNEKGFKVLDPHIRIIQSDGVDIESINGILYNLHTNGYSADNIAFGMGGALLQKLNRDTQRFAMKCSAIQINGEWHDVFKHPTTDNTKNSKAGRLKLTTEGTKRIEEAGEDLMVTCFKDGVILKKYTLEEVRNSALA